MTSPTIRAGIPAPAQITALQEVREYPAVSLLLTTTPAAELTHADRLRLDALAATAVDRLRSELQPAAAALALYASASTDALIRLPVPVRDRAVVDPTFATRDLVRALHRTPRHLVLALNAGNARLFDAAADTLLPALTSTFPMHAGPDTPNRGRGRADRPPRDNRSEKTDSTGRSTRPSAPTPDFTPHRSYSWATTAPPPRSVASRSTALASPAPSAAT